MPKTRKFIIIPYRQPFLIEKHKKEGGRWEVSMRRSAGSSYETKKSRYDDAMRKYQLSRREIHTSK